jgi:hypothetical protein
MIKTQQLEKNTIGILLNNKGSNIKTIHHTNRACGSVVVEALRYNPEGRGIDS